MNTVEVALYFDEQRMAALQDILSESGSSVETELKNQFRFLYEQLVPEEQRFAIEAQIAQDREQERIAAEARKRFAVYHVHEHGTDSYFTSQHFKSFNAAGYRYRRYARNELDSMPKSFAEAFMGSDEISKEQFSLMQSAISDDPRILAVMDFDLDEGVVTTAKPELEEYRSYSLHDVSVAAYKAYRGDYYSSAKSAEIFADALSGKEIEPAPLQDRDRLSRCSRP